MAQLSVCKIEDSSAEVKDVRALLEKDGGDASAKLKDKARAWGLIIMVASNQDKGGILFFYPEGRVYYASDLSYFGRIDEEDEGRVLGSVLNDFYIEIYE